MFYLIWSIYSPNRAGASSPYGNSENSRFVVYILQFPLGSSGNRGCSPEQCENGAGKAETHPGLTFRRFPEVNGEGMSKMQFFLRKMQMGAAGIWEMRFFLEQMQRGAAGIADKWKPLIFEAHILET